MRPAARPVRRLGKAIPLLAAIAGGVIFLVLTDGGRHTRRAEPLLVQIDRLAEKFGFGLGQAWVSGHRRTADRDILDALDMEKARSLIAFDKDGARDRIKKLPWIAEARILTVWPGRVEVRVSEFPPYAVWRHADYDLLIARDGRRLARVRVGSVKGLPVIAGPGANVAAEGLIAGLLSDADRLRRRLLVAEWVGGRRWTLHLDDGRRIQLPEKNFAAAYRATLTGPDGQRLWRSRFGSLDLRDPRFVRMRSSSPGLGRAPS